MTKIIHLAAIGTCLLLSLFASIAQATNLFYPISNGNPLSTAKVDPAPTENSIYEGMEALAPTAAAILEDRFFICSDCPAPFPNSQYTPPARRDAVSTTIIQSRDAPLDTTCQGSDKAMKVNDVNNVAYYICCPTTMDQGAKWDSSRGLQCCSDMYMQSCKHDPTPAIQCSSSFSLIADYMNGISVCKDSGTSATFPANTGDLPKETVTLSAVPATSSMAVTSGYTHPNGSTKITQCDLGLFGAIVGMSITLVVMSFL